MKCENFVQHMSQSLPVDWSQGPFIFMFTKYLKAFLDKYNFKYDEQKLISQTYDLFWEFTASWAHAVSKDSVYRQNKGLAHIDENNLLKLCEEFKKPLTKKAGFLFSENNYMIVNRCNEVNVFMKIFSNLFSKPQKPEFRKNFYSQDGEDTLLTAFYESQPEYKGFYVDIGALHPLRFSNTQIFYDRGWHGINIDATPGSMKLFNKVRPNDINI